MNESSELKLGAENPETDIFVDKTKSKLEIDRILTEDRFQHILELFTFNPNEVVTIDHIQYLIETEGNKLRDALRIPRLSIGGLVCAGFVDPQHRLYCNDAGDLQVISYITSEEKVIGYAVGGPTGSFVADAQAIREILTAFCLRDK